MSGCRFFVFEFRVGKQETRNNIEYVNKGFTVLDRQAERSATLTLVSRGLLLLLLFCRWRSSAVDILRISLMPDFEVGNRETHNKIEYVYKRRVRPTSPAYSDVDPGLVCPTAAAAVVATAATSAAAGDFFSHTEE